MQLSNIKEAIVEDFNQNNKVKLKVEDTISIIRDLATELNSKKRDHKIDFKNSGVDPKEFTLVVNNLLKRGLNKNQKEFIRQLKGDNGKLNSSLVREKIWNELSAFMRIFKQEINMDDLNNEAIKSNADIEKTSVTVLGALCSK